jgi:hypothetical protein
MRRLCVRRSLRRSRTSDFTAQRGRHESQRRRQRERRFIRQLYPFPPLLPLLGHVVRVGAQGAVARAGALG